MKTASKWLVSAELNAGCADISYNWESESRAQLVVRMHFSRVVDGHEEDLEIVFDQPLAIQWEDESFGLIDTPSTLPKISGGRFDGWTYPLLVIDGSTWRTTYADRIFAENDPDEASLKHYFLVSLNDLLHVLTRKQPTFRWMTPK